MADIAVTAVGFLLENLKEFVVYNADLVGRAEDNDKWLLTEREVMKGFLKKCTKESSDNVFLDYLTKDIRRSLYRIEDAIGAYEATASKQKFRGVVKGALCKFDHAMELRNIGKEVEAIRSTVEQLYHIYFEAMRLKDPEQKEPEQRVKVPPVGGGRIRFKDAMKHIMKLVNEGPEDVQTILICGMPGLGKTTLARNIFQDPSVEHQFVFRAFMEVSAEIKTREVLLKILGAIVLVTEEMNRMSEDELAKAIKDHFEKGSFLIVFDNVCTQGTWDELKRALLNNQMRSRVLITTSQKHVAEYARQGFEFEPYHLGRLTREASQELFREKVFGKKDKIPSDLLEHESRILDWCDGLPLAIVVVAGILTNKNGSVRLEEVADKVESCKNAKAQQAKDVIQLSFSYLPYDLKPCFLYLGVFPVDFEISSKTLVQLWVSEGLVPPDNEAGNSEDVAEDYLEELASRNLVMVKKRRFNGSIKTIQIHGTVREFCTEQAFKEEFFREIEWHDQVGNIAPDNDHRLCINSNALEYFKSKPSGRLVRTFLSFAKEHFFPVEHISRFLKAFKLLRVLDIRSIMLIQFPVELYSLFLLKYIAMYCDFRIIPKKMSNLRNLQTLMVETTRRSIEIRADIWKMTQLRQLETNAYISMLTTGEASSPVNTNLQTLLAISPECCRLEVFRRAPKLKKLGICGTLASGGASLFHFLSRLEFLEKLKLLNDRPVKLHFLPGENCFPTSLTRLTLQNTMLDWKHMSTLGKLTKLEVLKLKDNAFLGEHWDTECNGFYALRVLHIGSEDLISWTASASHFPNLRHLSLKHCLKLEAIPSDFVNISSLQLIDIYCCNGAVATSARNLQLGKHQVQAQDKDDISTTLKLSIFPRDQ